MTEHALYNIKRGPHGYAIGKFDSDLNLLAAYNVDLRYCSCPAGPRPSCKHRKMLPRMLAKVDTDEFYCYETQTWSRPLDEAEIEAAGRQRVVEGQEQEKTYVGSYLNVPVYEVDSIEPPKPAQPSTPTIRRR